MVLLLTLYFSCCEKSETATLGPQCPTPRSHILAVDWIYVTFQAQWLRIRKNGPEKGDFAIDWRQHESLKAFYSRKNKKGPFRSQNLFEYLVGKKRLFEPQTVVPSIDTPGRIYFGRKRV